MRINYNTIADALYFYVRNGKVRRTIPMTGRLLVDVDKTGNIVGVEMLDVSSQIRQQSLPSIFYRP
jgi:uncharacterized protein YuzE